MIQIHKLAPEFLRPIWKNIFASDDPFGWPYVPSITSGVVFYPTNGYHLTAEQYKAVIGTCQELGEQGFVVSIIEGQGEIVGRGEHWWCEYPRYADYLDLPLVLENAIYSRTSAWGIMISHEDHAIVGGNEAFVKTVRRNYPQWTGDLENLKNEWECNPHGSWVADVIAKVAS